MSSRNEFVASIRSNAVLFGVDLSDEAIERLADYYDLILEHNPLLHLVGPCPPTDFATRHILESLTMLKHLPDGTRFADIGSGGGLPAIPCLIVREDLRAVLIESKEKKATFLVIACEALGLADRTQVIARQFTEVEPAGCTAISGRALDKFSEKLPRVLKWAGRRKLLLFSGDNVVSALTALGVNHVKELMPLSDRRYLIVA